MATLTDTHVQLLHALIANFKTDYSPHYATDVHLQDHDFIDLYSYMWHMHSYIRNYDVAMMYDIFMMSPANIHLHYGLDNSKFKAFYRIDLTTFKRLVSICKQSKAYSLLHDMSVEMQVACVFWRFSNTHFGSFILIRSGLSMLSYELLCARFVGILKSVGKDYIHWPYNDAKRAEALASGFKTPDTPLEGVLGVIHNQKIVIIDNEINGSATAGGGTNTNNKQHLALINSIGVCDHQGRFLFVEATNAGGRSNKSNAFATSRLMKSIMLDPTGMFPKETYLLADASFPLMDNVIPPFELSSVDSDLNRDRTMFNRVHALTKAKTKHVYKDMLCRWRFLWAHELNHQQKVRTFFACCVLHNMCIDMGDQENRGFKDWEFHEAFIRHSAMTPSSNITLQKGKSNNKKRKLSRALHESEQAGYIRREWLTCTLYRNSLQTE